MTKEKMKKIMKKLERKKIKNSEKIRNYGKSVQIITIPLILRPCNRVPSLQ